MLLILNDACLPTNREAATECYGLRQDYRGAVLRKCYAFSP